ncbi:MAG: N-acetylmuramoyl-L-alanine amidase [Bacteroidales bacterium]|nr:N-acetylmuramoyl-L-alanine amidase [Bacteroidales bacterium]
MKMRLILLFSCICIASALSAQSDSVRTVVAKQGDGIYKILRENGYEAKDYYHKFLEINKDKIQLEDQLILGETYILPEKHDTIKPEHIVVIDTVPALCVKPDSTVSDSVPICIPAPSQEKMPQTKMDLRIADTIKGTALKGAIFYLIAGHGGPDPGATSYVDGVMISEDEYAYDITLRLARCIEEQSGKVYMIIDDPDDGIRSGKILKIDYDEYYYPDFGISRDKTQRLVERADAVNKLYYANKTTKYQRVVEIHIDSRSSSQRVDAFFYYCHGSTKGKALAERMYNVFRQKYAKFQPNRGYFGSVEERNLLVIKRVIPPAAFMEAGNINNERDRKRLLDANNRQALANWLCEALKMDYEANK